MAPIRAAAWLTAATFAGTQFGCQSSQVDSGAMESEITVLAEILGSQANPAPAAPDAPGPSLVAGDSLAMGGLWAVEGYLPSQGTVPQPYPQIAWFTMPFSPAW